MKKIYRLVALVILPTSLCLSCQKTQEDDMVTNETAPSSHILTCVIADNPDSKVAIDASGKTTWVENDEIFVHAGASGNKSIVVKLKSEDISADGKKATIDVGELAAYSRGDYISSYYAIYPAAAVTNANPMYYNTRVNDFTIPAMGGYDDGAGNMIFRNLCAVIEYTVSGSFDSFSFSGNNSETVTYTPECQWRVALPSGGVEQFELKLTSDGASCTPQTSITGSVTADGSTKHYICIPNGANLSGGFTLNFIDSSTDTVIKVLSTKTAVNLAKGDYLLLGDITTLLHDPDVPSTHNVAVSLSTATDLSSKDGPSNCYVITAAGNYKLPVVKGNDSGQSPGYVYSVQLVWETYNTSVVPTPNSVIEEVDFDGPSNYVYFKTPSTLKPGNALIAAKDRKGRIMWSWHIWIPETTFSSPVTHGIYSSALMDRNLGALKAASTGKVAEVETFGLMYQWGRKDPFMGPGANNSSTPAAVYGTAASDHLGEISITEALRNPTLIAHKGEIDSSSGGRNWVTPADNTLWKDDAKTIYDPCPPGYRVPARNTGTDLHSSDLSAKTGWGESSDYKYFTIGDPVAVFPFTGYYDDYALEYWPRVDYTQSRFVLWTAHHNSDNSAYFVNVRLGSNHALSNRHKSTLGSIRCVVE